MSIVLSGIVGLVILVGVVFAINQTYLWVLNHISNVNKYSTFNRGGGEEIQEEALDT